MELTDIPDLYIYHAWMRYLVKLYRFIDFVAIVMSLVTMITSRYWYIFLIVYFILRLICVMFYFPSRWCRCATYKVLIFLCTAVLILTFSFYMTLFGFFLTWYILVPFVRGSFV